MSDNSHQIDLQFRPETYFSPLDPKKHILSHIKGVQRREALKTTLNQDDLGSVPEEVLESDWPEAMREVLGSVHPAFLGGEFLPNKETSEVEIARVTLVGSVTSDVTSVYARYADGTLHYRVVDEYDGDTLTGPCERTSDSPLTLSELIDFLDGAWPLMPVLEMNYSGDLEQMLAFFKAESAFYPDLDALYRKRVRSACTE